MELWHSIVLGLVQGLTEFLPVSSSAHLRVVGELIGSSDPGAAFTAITQIGTEAAVIIYFRRDLARILSAWWYALCGRRGRGVRARTGWSTATEQADHDAQMAWFIALGTLPIVVLGLGFQDVIENTFRNLYLITATLAGFAVILWIADRIGAKKRQLQQLTMRDSILFGFAQALALIPGVSRSGGTITMGLLMGYTREAAARYSFLLALPAVLGSGFFQLAKSLDDSTASAVPMTQTVVATVVAFAVGYVVIVGFLRLITKRSYAGFVWYRIAAAAVILVLLATNVLSAYGTHA
ncbi:undecaprenyl-diphosphatase [Micrococcales bacterium KH10]|nr:undecaprenyl-diphosphatase [Micrococcales bacterium KH10]